MLKFVISLFCVHQLMVLSLDDGTSYFMSYPVKTNWFKAYKFCASRGQDLLSVESLEKLDAIGKYFGALNINNKFSQWNEEIWTSGTDNGVEGHFYWMPSGSDFNYSQWKTHEPNGGNNENCVALWNVDDSGYRFKWNDAPCTLEFYFICENRKLPLIDVRLA